MILCVFDLETTGNKKQTAFPTEIGYLIFDTDQQIVIDTYTRLIKPEEGEESLGEKASLLTGIKSEHLEKHGYPIKFALQEVFSNLFDSYSKSALPDFFVAHNGNDFDRPIFYRICQKYLSADKANLLMGLPWIDTLTDIKYPKELGSRALASVCAHYRFYIQDAHRAIHDCFGVAHLLKQFDIYEIIKRSLGNWFEIVLEMEPAYNNRALFEEQKEHARELGFWWDDDRKVRYKKIPHDDYDDLCIELEKRKLDASVFQIDTWNQHIEGYQHWLKECKS